MKEQIKKLTNLITAFQNLGFVIRRKSESVLYVWGDKEGIRHDFRVKEKYAGAVDLILMACGYETAWDNDSVCKIRDAKQVIVPIMIKEYHTTHTHIIDTTSDRLLDYITEWGSGRYAVWVIGEEPVIDIS